MSDVCFPLLEKASEPSVSASQQLPVSAEKTEKKVNTGSASARWSQLKLGVKRAEKSTCLLSESKHP